MMKMDVSEPNNQNNLLAKVNLRFFEDTSFFLSKTNKIKSKNLDSLIDKVLYSERI